MDPYIGSPEPWSDFHNNLASEIRVNLKRHIQLRYFPRLTAYVTYEVVEIGQACGVRPDVGVWHLEPTPAASAPSTATISVAPAERLVALEIPFRLHRVDIRTTV
jgi:Protein of unknown function (DUF4058)